MDLASAIIIMGTFIGGTFFIMDKYLYDRTFTTRKHLLLRFEEIKGKGTRLHDDMEFLITSCNNELLANYDCKDCLSTLREKIEIEYSESEYQKIKKMRLTKENILHYSERFKYHQDALISLRQEYILQLKRLEEQGVNNFLIN